MEEGEDEEDHVLSQYQNGVSVIHEKRLRLVTWIVLKFKIYDSQEPLQHFIIDLKRKH